MMSEQSARRIALLLKTKDELESWLDTFHQSEIDDPDKPFVHVQNIYCCNSDTGMGTLSGWDSDLTLPRDIVIRMLSREIEAVFADLHALGVDLSTPEPTVRLAENDEAL